MSFSRRTFFQFAFLLLAAAMARTAAAQPISLTAGTVYTQNFDTLASSGTSSSLPVGWALSEVGTSSAVNGQYAAGTGSGTAGDVYSFGAALNTERAFGTLLSGTLTPLTIAYAGEQWRLGASGRTDRLDFQLSLTATGLTTGTWTDYDALDF